MDPETGEPTGNIHEGVVDLVATAGGRRYTTASELLDAEDEGVSQAIVDGITKYNQEHASSYNQKVGGGLGARCVYVHVRVLSLQHRLPSTMQILKFHLLEVDFTIHGGELGRRMLLTARTRESPPLLSLHSQMLTTSQSVLLFLRSMQKKSNSFMLSSMELRNYFTC